MRRVLVAGTAVALVDGSLLGVSLALGWAPFAAVAALAGVVGAVLVAQATPPPRDHVAPATVTLGLPLAPADSTEATDSTEPTDATNTAEETAAPVATVEGTPAPVAA